MVLHITLNEINKMMEELVESIDDWSTLVQVDDLPLRFDAEALRSILLAGNRNTMKLIRKAMDIA